MRPPCECGCDASMEGRRKGARFLNAAHRKAAWSREHPETAPRPLASVENGSDARSGKVSTPGMGVRSYFASTEQADVVARELRLAAMQTVSPATADMLTDAAERIARASDRQRLKLQTSLELAA